MNKRDAHDVSSHHHTTTTSGLHPMLPRVPVTSQRTTTPNLDQ